MKSNNNIVGGSLNTSQYGAYANYLRDFANYMSSNGAALYAISVQNEPDYSPNYESCSWTSSQMRTFLDNNASVIPVKVIAPETVHPNSSWYSALSSSSQLDIYADHLYGGSPTSFGKEHWMTEHYTNSNISGNQWPDALDAGIEVANCMANNYSAYVWWYIRRSYGLIDENGAVTKRGYVMSQFAKFVRPGYYRINATYSPSSNVYVTAFKSGSTVVIVAINRNSSSVNATFNFSGNTAGNFTKYQTTSSSNVSNAGTITGGSSFSNTLAGYSISTFVGTIGSGGCTPTAITPYIQVDGGSWQQTSSVTVNSGSTVVLGPQPTSGGSWSWTGCGTSGTSRQQTFTATSSCTATATYTNSCGAQSTQNFNITVNGGGGGSTDVWLEAECGNVGSLWNTGSDGNASNGQYVTIQSGNNSTGSAPSNSAGYIDFPFSVSQSGTYTMFARVLCPTPNDDSYWVRMDGGSWTMWNNITTTSWAWMQFPNTFSLSSGSHTLTFAYREDGAELDKLNITNSGNTPSGQGSAATNCSGGGGGGGSYNITVRAHGTNGDENITLSVGGSQIASWTLGTSYASYTASTSQTGGIDVTFTNDQGTTRDVQVDYIVVDGTTEQAEDQATNTGVWQNSSCGGSYSEWLHCNGYIAFSGKSAVSRVDPFAGIDHAVSDVLIYPNPVTVGTVTLKLIGMDGTVNIRINDLSGRLIREYKSIDQTIVTLNPDLKAGVYIMQVTNGSNIIVKKFSVE